MPRPGVDNTSGTRHARCDELRLVCRDRWPVTTGLDQIRECVDGVGGQIDQFDRGIRDECGDQGDEEMQFQRVLHKQIKCCHASYLLPSIFQNTINKNKRLNQTSMIRDTRKIEAPILSPASPLFCQLCHCFGMWRGFFAEYGESMASIRQGARVNGGWRGYGKNGGSGGESSIWQSARNRVVWGSLAGMVMSHALLIGQSYPASRCFFAIVRCFLFLFLLTPFVPDRPCFSSRPD